MVASGDTLSILVPFDLEPPSTLSCLLGSTNNHPVLVYESTTGLFGIFTTIMPQNYSNTTGVTVYIESNCASTTGTVGWLLSMERMDVTNAPGTDSFGAVTTVTATSANATANLPIIQSAAITKGTNMDSVVAGDTFRLKVGRDVANDTAVNPAQIFSIEIRET